MSLVDVKIELGLDLTGGLGRFVLDNDAFGVLGTSQLDALVFYDVTSFVQSLSTNRGRSRQLDYFNAGSAVVNFNNRGREFDPLNTDSVYYPGVRPRNFLKITCKDYPVFYGFVNDWDLEYGIDGNDSAVATCSDAFMVLSNQVLSAFTPSAQLSGARVNAVLDRSEVDFIGGRDISVGSSDLGAYAVDAGTNVLSYLRQVEKSEQGSLFVDAVGDIIFRGRTDPPESATILFADDGSGIPYQTLMNEYGDELLYNYIKFTSPAGVEQVQSDLVSISKYQISQLSDDRLLNSSTGIVNFLASASLNKFKEPRVRLTGFQVQMQGLDETHQNDVLSIELAGYIDLKRSFNVGLPSSLTQFSFVSGVSHNVSPDSHTVVFTVEAAEGTLYLLLGDAVAGKLDFGVLDI